MGAGCKLHINGIVEKRRSGLVGEVIRRLVGPDRPSADNRGTLSNGQERRQWLRPGHLACPAAPSAGDSETVSTERSPGSL